MQFGVGILGANYSQEENLARVLADDRPPHPNFARHAHRYAAKIAAGSILYEPPTVPDLSDDAIIRSCAACARPVHRSEAHMVREAFQRIYGATA